jgi:hypothetical protein
MSWVKTAERIEAIEAAHKRTLIRAKFNVSNAVPVMEGAVLAPVLIGSKGGHFTKGGDPIAHPTAYAKRGWSNMVYRASTQKIIVPTGQ